MITLLSRLFIKNHTDYADPTVRRQYGSLCSIVGIMLNILLFIGKYIAGTISGSIAIVADGLNSISDAFSSLITLVSFKLAGKKPDPSHPFGHGRIEYIAGLIVSFIILYTGIQLFIDSIDKIRHPEEIESSLLIIIILVVSILVKLYMVFYNHGIGKKINSATMSATATDSFSDVASTFVVLLCTLLAKYVTFPLDGYCGLLVSCLVIYAGFSAARETVAPLLGQPADKETVDEIERIVMSHDGVIGIHDLVLHDYGPGRRMVSLHVEVPGKDDIFKIHDMIDNIEGEIYMNMQIEATIHMDPVDTEDPRRDHFMEVVAGVLHTIDPKLTFHDFRIVPGDTHTNLVFDVVTPAGYKSNDDELREAIFTAVLAKESNVYVSAKIDRDFTDRAK